MINKSKSNNKKQSINIYNRTSLYDIIPLYILDVLKVMFDSEETKIGHLKEHFKIVALNKKKIEVKENIKKGIFSLNNCNANKPDVLEYSINSKELIKGLKEIEYDDSFDYYISINTFKTEVTSYKKINQIHETGRSSGLYSTGKNYKKDKDFYGNQKGYKVSRTEKNIMGLKNIVVDIDCHNKISKEEMINIKNKFINSSIFVGLPVPTAVLFSGRGFHIYYSIHEVATALIKPYKTISREIAKIFDKKIKELGLDKYGYEVDITASSLPAGLIRLEGTPNTKSSIPTQLIQSSYVKYDINELKNLFNIRIPEKKAKNNYKVKYSDNNTKKHIYKTNPLLNQRINIIESCIKRQNRNHSIGCRDKYCFAYYNTMKQIVGPEKAIYKVKNFNNRTFDQPLSENEINNIIKGVNNVATYSYKYTNERFAELLELTDAEIKEFGLYYMASRNKVYITTREKLAQEKRNRKEERNKRIINTYLSTGSVKKTASIIGVCENTIRNIIRKYPEKVLRIKRKTRYARDRRIFNNFIRTLDIKKAAKAGKCCRNTAAKVVKKYANLNQNIERAFDEIEELKNIDNDIFNRKAEFHQLFKRKDYCFLEKKISNTMGLCPEDINIAIAPYLIRSERELSDLARI